LLSIKHHAKVNQDTKSTSGKKCGKIIMAQTSKEGFNSISSQAWRGESSWAATANVEKQALVLSSSPWVNKTNQLN